VNLTRAALPSTLRRNRSRRHARERFRSPAAAGPMALAEDSSRT